MGCSFKVYLQGRIWARFKAREHALKFANEHGGRIVQRKRRSESAGDSGYGLAQAVQFLQEQLCDGPKTATEMTEAGSKEGHGVTMLRRARKSLGVESNMVLLGGMRYWEWSLPGGSNGAESKDSYPGPAGI